MPTDVFGDLSMRPRAVTKDGEENAWGSSIIHMNGCMLTPAVLANRLATRVGRACRRIISLENEKVFQSPETYSQAQIHFID